MVQTAASKIQLLKTKGYEGIEKQGSALYASAAWLEHVFSCAGTTKPWSKIP